MYIRSSGSTMILSIALFVCGIYLAHGRGFIDAGRYTFLFAFYLLFFFKEEEKSDENYLNKGAYQYFVTP